MSTSLSMSLSEAQPSSGVPPSTEKRRAKASKVFGDMFSDDVDGSLCYSPSPMTKEINPKHPNEIAGITLSPIRGSLDGSVNSQINQPSPTVLFSQLAESATPPIKALPAEFGATPCDDKENTPNSAPGSNDLSIKSVLSRTSQTSQISKARSMKNTTNPTPPSTNSSHKSSSSRSRSVAMSSETRQKLNRMRSKSPMRRDMVKRTQDAIRKASTSVNQTLKGAKNAKKVTINSNQLETKKVRFQWEEDILEAKHFNEETEKKRREILRLKNELSSKHFRERARQQHAQRSRELAKIEKEYLFNSQVHREQQQKLKQERDERRRQSTAKRANIRANNKVGKERMKMQKLNEDNTIFELRHTLSDAGREYSAKQAEARRKSYQFRAGDAKRIRALRSTWTNDVARQTAESYELTRQADRDVDNYKKMTAEERRQSLECRNARARQIRQEEGARRANQMADEHNSYELKWAGEKDAEAYQAKLREERRQSLANRNQESARHDKVMRELRQIASEKETESYMLKWAAENDAKDYLAKKAEERRQSLQQRGREFVRQKQYDEDQHSIEVNAVVKDGQLKSQDHHDVKQYKKSCEERDRRSLQYRGKKFALEKLEERLEKAEAQSKAHESFELKSESWRDVQEYIKDCKKRKRKSLALRAKEKRSHMEWAQREKERALQETSRDVNSRLWDRRHVELAKQTERAKAAADALRNAGVVLKGNPFSSLLE